MSLARDWMVEHGISLPLAASVGLHRKGEKEVLYAPYERADGSKFERYREFPDGHWKQPKGEPLALWWPLGRAHGATVLLTEGEGDTLAAATVLDKATHPWLNGVCPVGLPGASMPAARAASELGTAGTKRVYLALDNDRAGQEATRRLLMACSAAGVRTSRIHLPDGKDLAECLVANDSDLRETWLADEVENAEVVQWKPLVPHKPATKDFPATDLDLIAPADYFERLTGEQPGENGMVRCPLPDHDERTPSCKVYGTPAAGWFCYGCYQGGSIFTLAMALWDVGPKDARKRLAEVFDLEMA